MTALVCQSAGGPQKYTGRSMKKAHEHLAITEKELAAMAADFRATLNQFKVPLKEQMELFSIAESVKADIVVPPRPGVSNRSPRPGRRRMVTSNVLRGHSTCQVREAIWKDFVRLIFLEI